MTTTLLEYAQKTICMQKITTVKEPVHMFIYGPSKSLKSSIIMDFAVAICNKSICRVCGETSRGCDCCSFVMLRSEKSRSTMDFPLLCNRRAYSNEQSAGNPYQPLVQDRKRKRVTWSEKTMRTIQIKYVNSFSDIVRFLASVPLLPHRSRPQLGIIMDDLECFLNDFDSQSKTEGITDQPGNEYDSFLSNEQAMKLMHVVALVRDTVGDNELHIIACMDSNSRSLSKPLINMIQNFIPFFASVEQQGCTGEIESCTTPTKDSKHLWMVDISRNHSSGYGFKHNDGSNNSCRITCEIVTKTWFDDDDMDEATYDYSTHQLEWWCNE